MSFLHQFFLVATYLLVWLQVGQQPAHREAGGKESDTERNRQQAVTVLHSLVEPAQRIQLPEPRGRVLARLADALWMIDESLARKLFQEAFLATAEIKEDPDNQARDVREKRQRLREEILRLASKHDPELVTRLLSLLPEVERKVDDPLRPASEQTHQLVSSALAIVNEDPDRAASIVAKSLDDGVIDRTLFFLHDLRAKNPAEADRLFELALRAVATRTPPNLNELLVLGSYLFTERARVTYTTIEGRPAINISPGIFAAAGGNASLTRLYLDAAFQLLSRYASVVPQQLTPYETGLVYATIQQLLPLYERSAWELLPSLASLMSQMSPYLPNSVRAMTAHQPANQPTVEDSVKAVLERANKEVSTEKQNQIYLNASYAFYTQKKYGLAREIAGKLSDMRAKDTTLQIIDTESWREKVRQGEVSLGFLPRNLDILQESVVVADLAKSLLGQKKNDEAKILLQGQIARVLADKTSKEKGLSALVGLTGVLIQIDSAEALQLLGAMATRLKDAPEIETNRRHARYDVQIGKMTIPFLITLEDKFVLERVIKQLAEKDFDSTLSSIQQIQSEAPRALLTILACQTVLERKAESPKTP